LGAPAFWFLANPSNHVVEVRQGSLLAWPVVAVTGEAAAVMHVVSPGVNAPTATVVDPDTGREKSKCLARFLAAIVLDIATCCRNSE
jgi:hypothetical protein